MQPHPAAVPILNKLRGIQDKGTYWSAFCPAHDDRTKRSLSVREGTLRNGRKALGFHCFTGCDLDAIVAALGITRADLYLDSPQAPRAPSRASGSGTGPSVVSVKDYEIRDTKGALIAVHHRKDLSDGSKQIWWTRNGERGLGGMNYTMLPLYGVHLLEAWTGTLYPESRTLFVAEGEKATEALWRRDLKAVGTVTGASAIPSGETLSVILGWDIFLWPDNDATGRAHMNAIAAVLAKLGQVPAIIEWPEAPPKGDAADVPGSVVIDEAWVEQHATLWEGEPEAVLDTFVPGREPEPGVSPEQTHAARIF